MSDDSNFSGSSSFLRRPLQTSGESLNIVDDSKLEFIPTRKMCDVREELKKNCELYQMTELRKDNRQGVSCFYYPG